MISLFFNKNEKQEASKETKKTAARKIKEMTGQLQQSKEKAAAASVAAEKRNRSSVPKPRAAEERPPRSSGTRPSRIKKKEPISVIDTWTGEDMVKGIVLSEVLGPPKSKRKK